MKMLGVMLAIAILIGALTIAGCTGKSEGGSTAPGQEQKQNVPETSPQPPAGEGGAAQQEEQGEEEQGIDLTNYTAIMMSGQPVECTVTMEETTEEGMITADIHMYIKGEKVRIEITSSEGNFVEIQKDNAIYISTESMVQGEEEMEGTPFADCDWIMIKTPEVESTYPEEETPEETGVEVKKPEEMFKYNIHCNVGNFGDEKFETPGKVCDLSQLFQIPEQPGGEMPPIPGIPTQ
ncbi:hypothetical protein J7K41_02735 [Candidatus Micrarchaeota archaeon]|nr:hypothetical protein [Candidatus Micrarchaeota archaeon]